jgi:predicted transcriptional regulator
MPKSIQIKRSSRISDISAWHTLTLDDFAKYNYSLKNANRASIESVYSVIEKQSGQVTTRHIEKEIGLDIGTVRYAIKYLTKEGKIRRVRGLGTNKIEFYYKVCQSV